MKVSALFVLLVVPGALAGPFRWLSNEDEIADTKCALHCTNRGEFQYEVGKTYEYSYESSVLTHMHGASEDAARLKIKAVANIDVISKCEMALTVSDLQLLQSSEQSRNADDLISVDLLSEEALESNPLRFAFQDGTIGDLCPSDEETNWSLNLKRGILTAFQNSMRQRTKPESLVEIDVTGACPTTYSVKSKGWKTVEISKEKDLLGCKDRHYFKSALQATTYHLPDAIQSLPLLKGSHSCTHSIASEGYLSKAHCTEELVFRPFSRMSSGARTFTETTMQFQRVTYGTSGSTEPVDKRTNLLYDHSSEVTFDDQSQWAAIEKLTEICKITSQDGIRPEVPRLFSELVFLLRKLDASQLEDISSQIERRSVCMDNLPQTRKFFQDALPVVGTSSSVKQMVDMLLSKEVTGTEVDLWLTSFMFLQDPTMDMLPQLQRLLESENLREGALLPVTSLMNNLCSKEGTSCLESSSVSDILESLNDILSRDCHVSEANMDLMLTTLRAVGNVGHADKLAQTLSRCISSLNNPIEIRLTAVHAYRGITCKADRENLLELFMDTKEDTELRIASYLAIMKCSSDDLLKKVEETLKAEPVNQVGSFVWTHLTNLLKSENPHKQAVRQILEDLDLQKEFDLDRRKFSRNYELSFFSDKFSTGAMAESNLIWSSKSFLPRSAMLNLTFDLFGHSVNLLEVGGRVQGLESLLQKYLVPGAFKGADTKKDSGNSVSRCTRKNKANKILENHGITDDEPAASLYLRMFGNELSYHHLTGNDFTKLRERMNLDGLLSSLVKGRDLHLTQNAMFLDSSVTVPTLGGLPLSLAVNGTASVELIASSKLDSTSWKKQKTMVASLNIRPSGAVEIAGIMQVRAGRAKAGLKMTTTLHSSTGGKISVDLTSGQVLSMDIDFARKKQEILDVQSEFFIVHDTTEVKQNMASKNRIQRQACTPKTLVTGLGLEMCAQVSFQPTSSEAVDQPFFPFNGPVSLSVSLDKVDAPRGYKIMGKQIQNKFTSIAQLSIDTPGSSRDRAIALSYFIDIKGRSGELEFATPWKKILAKGAYDENNSHQLTASVSIDGNEYNLVSQVKHEKDKVKDTWTPTLEITRPDIYPSLSNRPTRVTVGGKIEAEKSRKGVKAEMNIDTHTGQDPIRLAGEFLNKKMKMLSGSITLSNKKTYASSVQMKMDISDKRVILEPMVSVSAAGKDIFLLSGNSDYRPNKLNRALLQIKVDSVLKKPLLLDYKITQTTKKTGQVKYRGQVKVNSQFATGKAVGNFVVSSTTKGKGPMLASKLILDYALPAIKAEFPKRNKIIISTKAHNRSTKTFQKYDVTVNFNNKKMPDYNFFIQAEGNHKDSYTSGTVTVRPGGKGKVTRNDARQLTLGAKVEHKIKPNSALIKYSFKALYPIKKLEYELRGKHEHHLGSKSNVETYGIVTYSRGKSVEIRLLGEDNSKKKLNVSGSLDVKFPGRDILINTHLEEKKKDEYLHTVLVQTQKGEKNSLITSYQKKKEHHHEITSELILHDRPKVKVSLSAALDPDDLEGSVKAEYGSDVYNGKLTSKAEGKEYRSNTWDFITPERRIKGNVEGGHRNGKVQAKLLSLWDADKDVSQAIEAEMSATKQDGWNYRHSNALVFVKTPFANAKHWRFEYDNERKSKEFHWLMKFVLGMDDNELSLDTTVKRPLSLEKIEVASTLKTPWEILKKGSVDIVHKFDGSNYLSTTVKGAYNDDNAAVSLFLANRGDAIRNYLESSATFSSSLKDYEKFEVKVKHSDDHRLYETDASLNRNGDEYKISLKTNYFRVQLQLQADATLTVTVPEHYPVTLKWVHKNTLHDLNSTVTWQWQRRKEGKLDIGAKFNLMTNIYAADIIFSMPRLGEREGILNVFSVPRDFELAMRHKFERVSNNPYASAESSVSLKLDKDQGRACDIKLTYRVAGIEARPESWDFDLSFNYEGFGYTVDHASELNVNRMHVLSSSSVLLWKETKRYWDEKSIRLEIGSDIAALDRKFSGSARLITPFEGARNVELSVDWHKAQGEWLVGALFSSDIGKRTQFNLTMDVDNFNKMNIKLDTPYDRMKHLEGEYVRTEDYNLQGFLEMKPIFDRVRIQHTMTLKPHILSKIRIDIPHNEFKFVEVTTDYHRTRRGSKTNVIVNYYPNKEINLDVKTKLRFNKDFPDNSKITIDLSTPFENFPSLKAEADLNEIDSIWTSKVKVHTQEPMDYADCTVRFKNTESSFLLGFDVLYGLSDRVFAETDLNWADGIAANVTFVCPDGRSSVGFKQKVNSLLDFQDKLFIEVKDFNLNVDVGLKHDEDLSKAWLLYNHPGAEHSSIEASVHRIGNSLQDFDAGGFLKVGKYAKPYNVSLQYSYIQSKLASGVTFISPYTKPVSYLLKYQNEGKQYEATIYGKYSEDFVDSHTKVDLEEPKREISGRLHFDVLNHKRDTGGYAVLEENDGFSGQLHGYCQEHEVTVKLEYAKPEPSVTNIDVNVVTTFEDYSDLGASATVSELKQNRRDKEPSGYKGSVSVEYQDDKEATLTFDIKSKDRQRPGKFVASAELSMPHVEGYEESSLEYSHLMKGNDIDADAVLNFGQNEKLTAHLEVMKLGEFVFTLTGPVKDFRDLTVSGKLSKKDKRLNGDAQLRLTTEVQPVVLDYDIQPKTEPAVMVIKMRSPFRGHKWADLTITHAGNNWEFFNNTAVFNSQSTGKATMMTVCKIPSGRNIDIQSTFVSSIRNMEDLRFSYKMSSQVSRNTNEIEATTVIGWSPVDVITSETTAKYSIEDSDKFFFYDYKYKTPFENNRNGHFKFSQNQDDISMKQSVLISHDDQVYSDYDFSYKYDRKLESTIEIRSPRPMYFELTSKIDRSLFDGSVNLNWDKRSPDSNVKLTAGYADRSDNENWDKDFRFKVIHPVRTLGMDCLFKNSDNEVQTSGQVTWDEKNGNTFSYDISWSNRTTPYSRYYDGSVKLGVPQRSVRVQGKLSDTGRSFTMDSSVYWDADKDETKRVVLSSSVTNQGKTKKAELNLNLPSINKQMNIGVTNKGGYGNTIVDSMTEISYSSDPRKTIVFTSKLEDTASDVNSNNYILNLGFVHPITKTNMQLTSQWAKSQTQSSFASRLMHLTATEEKKVFELKGDLDCVNQKMLVEVSTPIKSVTMEGQLTTRRGTHRLVLGSKEDGKPGVKAEVTVDPQRRSTDLEFSYDKDDLNKLLLVSGRYINSKSLQLDVSTARGREKLEEGLVAITLNNSNLIHTRVLWRPTMFMELQEFLSTRITVFSYHSKEAFSAAVNDLGTEVKAKYLMISKEITDEVGQIFQLMQKEINVFSAELTKMHTEMRRFYSRNDLHIRDMGEGINQAFKTLLRQMGRLSTNYHNYYRDVIRATNEWLEDTKNFPIAQQYQQAVQDLLTGLKDMRLFLENALDKVTLELENLSEVTHRKYLEISRQIDRKLNSYMLSLKNLPYYRSLASRGLGQGGLPRTLADTWVHLYDQLVLKGQEILHYQFHDIMQRDEYREMHAMASEIHQQFKYWTMEQTTSMAVKRVIDLSKNLLLMELVKLKDAIIDLEKSRLIIFDQERGELQFEVYIPVDLNALDEPPKIHVKKYLNQMQQLLNAPSWLSSYTNVWDTYYNNVPHMDPNTWIPPFEASAYLVGSQHFLTFDKVHYDFLGSCGYVLAQDMLADKFSIVVNFDRRALRNGVDSLCFQFENDISFKIHDNFKLTVNNKEAEMPFITEKVKILRERDHIRVEYIGGVTALLYPTLDVYKVTVSGWYHGRVGGMLGSFDNEPSNDLVAADSEDKAATMSSMSKEWEVSHKSCHGSNIARTPDHTLDKNNLCAKFFEGSSSKFRPCFKQVESSPFLEMCYVYMDQMSESEAVLKVTEQYRLLCRDQGVYIGGIEEAAHCEGENVMVNAEDPLYQSADILFVLEENKCNEWVASSLATMVMEVNKALNSAGMKNNRFGLASYGRPGESVFVHTLDGGYFGKSSQFLRAVESFSIGDFNTPGDLVSAIRETMMYPYRPGVAKVLVLAPCSECEVGLLHSTLDGYLAARGFAVHTLQDIGFSLSDNNRIPGTYRMYGMDNNDFFTNRIPERTRNQLEEMPRPSDYCATMASTTDGAVFDTTHLTGRSNIKREFIQAFSKRIGWSTKLPTCQECRCTAGGRTECTVCDAGFFSTLMPLTHRTYNEAVGVLHDIDYKFNSFLGLVK